MKLSKYSTVVWYGFLGEKKELLAFWHIRFHVVCDHSGVKFGVQVHDQMLMSDMAKTHLRKKSSYCVLALYGRSVPITAVIAVITAVPITVFLSRVHATCPMVSPVLLVTVRFRRLVVVPCSFSAY